MRSNPNLIDAPSPVIGYFKLDNNGENERTNGTTGKRNGAASSAASTAPAMAASIFGLIAIIVLKA